ncbi:tripartite tricarboxylate transporter TctB family protein [Nitratireductor rhodophyticola]|uniref:tripartite tricarboxylate transporter TctB family protein n=1 Tax=Nitratireductor rhodophyticola TaxID=2854036 RepID=UPI00300BDB74
MGCLFLVLKAGNIPIHSCRAAVNGPDALPILDIRTGLMMHRDVFVAAALVLLAVASAAGVWAIEGGARNFPLTMAGFLGVGASVLLVRSIHVDAAEDEVADAPIAYDRFLLIVAVTAGFALIMPWVGFYPATFLYLSSLYCGLSTLRPHIAIALAAALSVTIYILFGFFLAVPTPSGAVASFLLG